MPQFEARTTQTSNPIDVFREAKRIISAFSAYTLPERRGGGVDYRFANLEVEIIRFSERKSQYQKIDSRNVFDKPHQKPPLDPHIIRRSVAAAASLLTPTISSLS